MPLCLSRYSGESIMIGDDIQITIGEVNHRGKVRVLITAPSDLIVLRQELYAKKNETRWYRNAEDRKADNRKQTNDTSNEGEENKLSDGSNQTDGV